MGANEVKGRFDNLSTDQLFARDREARDEARAVRAALMERLRAECPVRVGKVYRIKAMPGGQYAGREILVDGIKVNAPHYDDIGKCYVLVWGPLKRPRQTDYGRHGGTYTSRCVEVVPAAIDLTSEHDPVDVPFRLPEASLAPGA